MLIGTIVSTQTVVESLLLPYFISLFIWARRANIRRCLQRGGELLKAAGKQSDRRSPSVSDAQTQLSVSSQILHNMQQES